MIDYLNQINKKETNPVLVSLRTYAKEHDVPIITEDGINFINQIIKLKNIKTILELGTAIAYSSIHMALNNDVHITTIERNDNMYNIAKQNINNNNLHNQITLIKGDALEVNEKTLPKFDLIFIDAAKAQSINFFNKYKPNLTKNGVIITDNLLFHGLIKEEGLSANLRQLTRKIDNFNKFIVEQQDFDTYIYNIGDGISLSIHKG